MFETSGESRLAAPRVDVVDWAFRIGLALFFVDAGLAKFSGGAASPWVGMFAKIGFGQWFRYATGWIEIVGGVILLVPAASFVAVLLLGGTMLGAIAVHLIVYHSVASTIIPGGLLLAIGAIGWKRWTRARAG
jgi:putative oxidoreductase